MERNAHLSGSSSPPAMWLCVSEDSVSRLDASCVCTSTRLLVLPRGRDAMKWSAVAPSEQIEREPEMRPGHEKEPRDASKHNSARR